MRELELPTRSTGLSGRDVSGAVSSRADAVRRGHLHDDVFRRLAADILNGELPPGSALPPERVLADQFGVSRLLVRQAVHRLAEVGLCRVRQGGATLIEDPATAANPLVGVLALELGVAKKTSLIELFEKQVLGAIPLLVLAEPRTTIEQAALLRSIIAEHERDPDGLAAFEQRFWTTVADIGQNSFYRREIRFWFDVVRSQPAVHHPAFGEPSRRIAVYRTIVDALERRSGAAALYLPISQMVLAALSASSSESKRTKARGGRASRSAAVKVRARSRD